MSGGIFHTKAALSWLVLAELVKAYGKDIVSSIASAQLTPAPLDITVLKGDAAR